MLNKVSQRLKKQNIQVEFDKTVEEKIIDELKEPEFGARPIRRIIQNLVEDRIVDKYILGEIKENSNINIYYEDDKLKLVEI